MCIEIGATNVASIVETFTPHTLYHKGDEKGYFSLGGSSIILVFEKDVIDFDADLLQISKEKIETRILMGQSIGRKI